MVVFLRLIQDDEGVIQAAPAHEASGATSMTLALDEARHAVNPIIS
jgi:hypothetical protein